MRAEARLEGAWKTRPRAGLGRVPHPPRFLRRVGFHNRAPLGISRRVCNISSTFSVFMV
jgi:hypothetical protein